MTFPGGVRAKGTRIAGAGAIIRARACGTGDAKARLPSLDSASENKGVNTSTYVGLSPRIRLVPIDGRNVRKQDGAISFGNGATSKNSPITGNIPGVVGSRVGVHLDTIDVNLEISTVIIRVRALPIAKGLV